MVFAPTPLPPDRSPLRYQHPSGAFTLDVPREWSVYAQNMANLSTAYFTPPGESVPAVGVAVINLAPESAPESITDLINLYQQQIRPDARRYTEQDRQAMEDGSWRMTGLRRTVGDLPQAVNTFIVVLGSTIGVLDVAVPENTMQNAAQHAQILAQREAIANTLNLSANSLLQPTSLETLSAAAYAEVEVVNVASWTAQTGVYFLTGELLNRGITPKTDLQLRVRLQDDEGNDLAEALDTFMGLELAPGGFAPFSLRFGQGQPPRATDVVIELQESPGESVEVYGAESMNWTDSRTFTEEGHLLITGTVSNASTQTLRDPTVIVTVFDAERRVIAAGFTTAAEGAFAPEESAAFALRIPEFGGVPVEYIVNVQAYADQE
ncbi:MAG: hypothetical protein OHK0046_32000 [Anaerolineae bacterium]